MLHCSVIRSDFLTIREGVTFQAFFPASKVSRI